jgi:hypothetical protein
LTTTVPRRVVARLSCTQKAISWSTYSNQSSDVTRGLDRMTECNNCSMSRTSSLSSIVEPTLIPPLGDTIIRLLVAGPTPSDRLLDRFGALLIASKYPRDTFATISYLHLLCVASAAISAMALAEKLASPNELICDPRGIVLGLCSLISADGGKILFSRQRFGLIGSGMVEIRLVFSPIVLGMLWNCLQCARVLILYMGHQ